MDQVRPKPVASDRLLAVIDAFLDWRQKNRAVDTYRWYLDRLQRFAKAVPGDLQCDQLRPYHVHQWIDVMCGIANGTKRNYVRSVQRAMRWGEQQGLIDRSPIAHMEKSAGGKLPSGHKISESGFLKHHNGGISANVFATEEERLKPDAMLKFAGALL